MHQVSTMAAAAAVGSSPFTILGLVCIHEATNKKLGLLCELVRLGKNLYYFHSLPSLCLWEYEWR